VRLGLGMHSGELLTASCCGQSALFNRYVDRRRLRREQRKFDLADEVSDEDDDIEDIVLELQPGEQLNPEDIDRAMEDPTIRPVPLFSSRSHKPRPTQTEAGATDPSQPFCLTKLGAQLYFGPGFENRLEMELDE
jgi:hypothetical protein